MTACAIELKEDGEIIFSNTQGQQVLRMKYPPGKMKVRIDEKLPDDEKLISSWVIKYTGYQW